MLHRRHNHPHRRKFTQQGLLSLAELQIGEQAQVVELHGGHGLITRMTVMGFTPGVEVSLIQNTGRGPLIASVRGARIALGRVEAHRILVRLLDNHES